MTDQRRRSIDIEGLAHGDNPIPAASRIGQLVASGGVAGIDVETSFIPSNRAEEVRHMFKNVKAIITLAGGEPEDIVKMTIWMAPPIERDVINEAWLASFPNAKSRPARHILQYEFPNPLMTVQCDFLALLSNG